ncbi:MAG TPA: (Fe-S)-binding protein [Gemmatimonadales bacterium]|jgi:glycolate oxidase iron-sulfur subunit
MTTRPVNPSAPVKGFEGLDPCVHCGFCLPACPTYEVTADEADSPRGRIVLMRALARGEMPADDPSLQLHLDRCLGCRGCESVCPAGVVFGPALEASRDLIAKTRPLPLSLRIALWVLARPARQWLIWLLSRLFRATGIPRRIAQSAGTDAPVVAQMMGMLEATRGWEGWGGMGRDREEWGRNYPHHPSPTHPIPPHPSSPLFRGCVQNGLFGRVHDATISTLAHNGVKVGEVHGQVCCGALAAHAGAHDFAKRLARENVIAFARSDGQIIVNSAGCGAMLRSYGDLLAGEELEGEARIVASRVRDISEALAELGPAKGMRPLSFRVAYDAPCHLLHAQKISSAPLVLLDAIPGITRVALEGSERCCGSAGLYSLLEPGMSREVLRIKLDAIRRAAPDIVVTGNPGCVMQIGAGLLLDGQETRVCHPVELLAWSYQS